MSFALRAGVAFEEEADGEYKQTIIGKLFTLITVLSRTKGK